jgi:hypothetical protein
MRVWERMFWIGKVKADPCVDCGRKYPPYVMHFDHIRGKKKFNIALGYQRTAKDVNEEIAKCELVCANCHAERTWKRRQASK